MARKKKNVREIEYTPSRYQQAIYDYIVNENGNLVVEAAAGAGKTTTLVNCIRLIPEDKSILLCAFNKDIVNELVKKAKGLDNVKAMTLHSLGLAMLRRNYPMINLDGEPNIFKYESFVKDNIRELSSIDLRRLNGKGYFKYIDNIVKYVDYGRYYLCNNERDLEFIENRYGIETIADEKAIAIQVMEWGKTQLESIDYTDMVWFPSALRLNPGDFKYDYIMVDECQDLNKAQRELILMCRKENTRMVSVGDENQTLYSFAGADIDSFKILKSLPNTRCLPLSISYRCPRNIVDYARQLVPTIEPNEANTEQGKVLFETSLDDVVDGDMVLCRNNAPLIQVYNEFIRLGKKAYIRGKEIGSNLKKVVTSTRQKEINVDCMEDGLFVRLYDDLFTTRNKIMEKYGVDEKAAMKTPTIEMKFDMIKALEVLSEGLKTTDELVSKIDELFPKKGGGEGIALSTIHKAKGLEANNVYIVCRSLMPSKSAKKDWEVRQEHNLEYVAYTRAKKILGFVSEKDFEQFDMSSTSNQSILNRIEELVNRVLYSNTKTIVTKRNALDIINKAKTIEKRPSTSSTVNINSTRKMNSFSDFFSAKKSMKLKR